MSHGILQGDTRAIMVEEVFPHAPEVLWRVLTTPDLVGRWLKMTPDGFEPVVGNRFTYQTTAAGAWDGRIHCEVLEVMPNQRLSYSWKGGHAENIGYGSLLDLTVTMFLDPVEGGTRLRVIHDGFELPRNETAYTGMGGGWKSVLGRVRELADERNEN